MSDLSDYFKKDRERNSEIISAMEHGFDSYLVSKENIGHLRWIEVRYLNMVCDGVKPQRAFYRAWREWLLKTNDYCGKTNGTEKDIEAFIQRFASQDEKFIEHD